MLSDSRENFRSQFVAVAIRPNVGRVWEIFMLKFDVRSGLRNNAPANFQESLEGMFCLHAWPLTQAEAQSSLIERGTFSEFSTSSAMTRNASAYAFRLASSC